MSNRVAIPVKTTLIKQFNKQHKRFMKVSQKAAPAMVEGVNLGRSMGLILKELLGRENITEMCLAGWLRDNPGALAENQVAWLMNFVRISNKVQGELKLFEEAPREVVQMTLQCAGLLPAEAGREGEQLRHEPNPISLVWKSVADLRAKFGEVVKSARRWDDETRKVVLRDIEKARAILAEAEEQILHPELKRLKS